MIKNIIGLGNCGCQIADEFKKWNNYIVYKVDTEDLKEEENFFKLEKFNEPEEYEKKPPKLREFFRGICEPCLFIVGGGGIVSAASLVILEQVKHVPIQILYITPDRNFLSQQGRLLDRTSFNVFQEMARSGLFERIWFVSNSEIENLADGIPINNYYSILNNTIASTFHAINHYSNIKPIAGNLASMPIGVRISTFGIVEEKENNDCLFFPLDFITDKQYIYVRSEETLNTDKTLMRKIKNNVLSRTEEDENGLKCRTSFIVSSGEQDFTYVLAHTSLEQEY